MNSLVKHTNNPLLLVPQSLEQLQTVAQMIARSDLAPKDYKGKWFVLFSHPADFTPVCTTEFVAFQKRYEKFRALNCELIGMSVDQVFSHIKWEEWIREFSSSEMPSMIGKFSNHL